MPSSDKIRNRKSTSANRSSKTDPKLLEDAAQQSNLKTAVIQRAKLAPNTLSARDILDIQLTLGNQAVNRIKALRASHTLDNNQTPVRESDANSNANAESKAQLTIGSLHDQKEVEVDAERKTLTIAQRHVGPLLQRHSNAELDEQVEQAKQEEDTIQAKRADIQRHFPKHEAFGGYGKPVPQEKIWRLDTIVPPKERERYKAAFIRHIRVLLPGMDIPTMEMLVKRIGDIAFEEDPGFHSPAQGQPNKIIINPSFPEFYTASGEPDVEAVRSTLIHEMFHSSSINHEGKDPAQVMQNAADRGFQSDETTLITQTEKEGGGTQETFDEAATEWFSMQLYSELYPEGTYKSSYFTMAPKTKSGGGEGLEGSLNTGDTRPLVAATKDQVPLVMQKLGISEAELMEMYLHDHAKLGRLLNQGSRKEELRREWREYEQEQLREKYPLTTNVGLKGLIEDVIREHNEELSWCTDEEQQIELLTEKLKAQHNVEVAFKPRTHNAAGKKLIRPLPATPGAAEALKVLPEPGSSWSTDDDSPAILNKGYVTNALRDLKIKPQPPHKSLKFVLVTESDSEKKTLDNYPPDRTYGTLPAVSFPGKGKPYDALKGFGGGGYEHTLHTAFLIGDHASSYHHYLHEIGHYKQHLEGYDETTVPNTILLDFHNILTNENTENHIRTLYSTKDKMSNLMNYKFRFADVKRDVENHKVMKKMFAEIETKIGELSPTYQELYKRNLTYEYFQQQGGQLKAWKTKSFAQTAACYITTACVKARGLADDCEELQTLRNFRDDYILNLPGGRDLVEFYYQQSPPIVDAIARKPESAAIYEELYQVIRDCVKAVHQARYREAFATYVNMVLILRERFAPDITVPELLLEASRNANDMSHPPVAKPMLSVESSNNGNSDLSSGFIPPIETALGKAAAP